MFAKSGIPGVANLGFNFSCHHRTQPSARPRCEREATKKRSQLVKKLEDWVPVLSCVLYILLYIIYGYRT